MINIGTEGILDDPEEAGNNNEPVWVDAGRKPVVEDFLVNDPGPSNEAKKAETELDCFNLFFDPLYQLIIEQTNLYVGRFQLGKTSNYWIALLDVDHNQ